MKLASILPISQFYETYRGQYAMLLAHLKDYYPSCNNKNCYRIMDNSLIELGEAVDMKTIFDAACQLDVDEIILPDVFRKGELTIESVNKSIMWLKRNQALYRFKLMAVCQGENLEEFEKCFHTLNRMPEINCIGIPKVSSTLLPEGRPGLEYLWARGKTTKQIHLLGCWDSLDEFRQYKNPQLIRSADTCIPALLARDLRIDTWAHRPPRTIDFKRDEIDVFCYRDIQKQLTEVGLL